MSPIRKIALYTSFLLSFSAQLPTFELHATAKMTIDDFKENKLEEKFPMYFKGFNRTDLSFVMRDIVSDEAFKSNSLVAAKLEELQKELMSVGNVKTEKLQEELTKMIEDKSKHTPFAYVITAARALMLISDKTEEEEQFFKTAGFSTPYTYINFANESDDNIWQALVNWRNTNRTNRDFDFTHQIFPSYNDPDRKQDALLAKRKQVGSVFFMNSFGKNEDLFGFLYLAWMYSKGIHPVPLTLNQSTDKIHGIKMSPWGKFCHDLAHHEIDPGENTIENFANHILNHYLSELRKNFKSFSQSDKEKYSISSLIEPVTEFAITVHEAYSEAITAILEESIKDVDTTSEGAKLSDEFKAFSAGAFVYTHENATDLSRTIATSSLTEIITSAIRPVKELVDKENQADKEKKSSSSEEKTSVLSEEINPTPLEVKSSDSSEEINPTPSEEKISVLSEEINPIPLEVKSSDSSNQGSLVSSTGELAPIETLIPTSSITGESTLTDQEIVAIVQERPLSEFRGSYIYAQGKINADEIASTSVKRNKFHIQAEFDMLDGAKHAYRIITQYSNRLNLSHDRQFLVPAKAVLLRDYNYTIPSVPSEPKIEDDATQFDSKILECRKELNLGRSHLLSYFVKTATTLSEKSESETLSISDQYALNYSRALRKLAKALPPFAEEAQAFIATALQPVNPKV
jgi:hypothetical protein